LRVNRYLTQLCWPSHYQPDPRIVSATNNLYRNSWFCMVRMILSGWLIIPRQFTLRNVMLDVERNSS
jgi:hypothetical protein